jgi:hypothetical protein
MNYRGDWEHESPAAVRTGEFLGRCRFSEPAALLRARREIDDVIVDGLTFEECVDRFLAHHRRRARAVLQKQRLRLPGLRQVSAADEPASALDVIYPYTPWAKLNLRAQGRYPVALMGDTALTPSRATVRRASGHPPGLAHPTSGGRLRAMQPPTTLF